MSSERILMKCGGCGRFQVAATILVLMSRLTCAILILLPVYISHSQPILCNLEQTVSQQVWKDNFVGNLSSNSSVIEINQLFCSIDVVRNVCSSLTLYKHPFTSTIRSQYDLFCRDWAILPSIASTCCMAGVFLGSFFVGTLSDNYGRLIVLSISGFISGVFSLLTLFSPYFWMHSTARFFVGLGASGLFSAGNSYIIEVVPLKQRLPVSIVALGGWNVGNLLLCLIAYFVRNHTYIQVFVSIATFHSVFYYFVMPESFRWLISTGKKELAIRSIVRMSKMNGRHIDKMEIEDDVDTLMHYNNVSKTNRKREQLKDILKYTNMRAYLAIFWTMFFIVSMVYYMLSLSSGKFSKDVFLGAFAVAGTTLATRVIIIIIGIYWGRVPVFSGLSGAVSVLLIATGILKWTNNGSSFVPVFLVISTFLAEASFSWIWIFAAEVFPTVIRTASVSTASGFARFGAIIAPQMLPLNERYPGIAYLICGVLAFLNFLLPLLKLPETKGFIATDNLEEADELLKDRERQWMKFGQVVKKESIALI